VDLGYAVYHPYVEATNILHDAGVAAMFTCMRSLCGPAWLPTAVLLPHSRPADVTAYRALFRVTPHFDAEFAAVRFDGHWMKRYVAGADPQRLAHALERYKDAGHGDVVHDAFRAVRMLMLHRHCTGDDLARMLGVPRRTLSRRLEAHGITFREILDTVRFDVARQLLMDSDIALDDVANTVGYASITSFVRSFQRWSGVSPGRWRRSAAPDVHAGIAAQPAVWPFQAAVGHRIAVPSRSRRAVVRGSPRPCSPAENAGSPRKSIENGPIRPDVQKWKDRAGRREAPYLCASLPRAHWGGRGASSQASDHPIAATATAHLRSLT